MLVNQFERFNHLIQFELPEKAYALPSPGEEYFEEIITALNKDAKEIVKKINSMMTIHTTLKKAAWRIRAYQDEMINLMDSITFFLEDLDFSLDIESVIPDSWHDLFMRILQLLSECLDYTQVRHPDLFFNDMEMPAYQERSGRAELREKLCDVQYLVPECSDSFAVLEWIGLPLKREQPLTFVQYHYLNKILTDVTEIMQDGHPDELIADKLREYLCQMDFNHPKFIEDCIQRLQMGITSGSSKSMITQYIQLKRAVNPIKHREGLSLYGELASVKVELLDFLNNEIAIHKALIEAEAIISPDEWKDFKVITTLSISELAGILRMLSDKGVVVHAEKEKLLQFFAFYFKAEGGKDFSLDGLLLHFDQNGEKALKQLRDFFN